VARSLIYDRQRGRLLVRRRGFTLIELLMVVTIIALIAALAIPNLIASRKMANETSCIASLKQVLNAETLFRETDREKDGNNDYGMLSELVQTGLVDSVLGQGTKAGYMFEATYSFTSSEFLWFGTGNPVVQNATGDRGFAINNMGAVFYSTNMRLVLDTSSCQMDPTYLPIK